MHYRPATKWGSLLLMSPFMFACHSQQQDVRVSFNKDIRPILNQNCISCHGGVKQDGGVSFIYREEALGSGKSGRPVVVPGKPHSSELIARVTSTDPETRMPYHAPALPREKVSLLKQWIKEGALWEDYWAFVAPKAQSVPEVTLSSWVRRPLDAFILRRLEGEGVAPSPEADRATLLRRVSFDLVGLPPTPEEVAAFLNDPSVDAYEKQVDRLLASPRYGERWASMWLDLARYADSKGFERDLPRPGMWPYRDWVIEAFNRNIPYDQFVIKQLAGDLLPKAALPDIVATSFHRQTPSNDECGSDAEEYRLVAVMDRVATTWQVLNGVTMSCAQCHSHPYDPIRHEEYYKFLAFFNSSKDADAIDDRTSIDVPLDESFADEALRVQREIYSALRELVARSRSQVGSTQWQILPVVSASVNEVEAFEWRLERLKAGKLSIEQRRRVEQLTIGMAAADAEKLRRSVVSASITAATSEIAKARTRVAENETPTLLVRNGEALAQDNTPMESIYELDADIAGSRLTALRLDALPVNPDSARHSPEMGFIVDRIDAWVVDRGGEKRRIRFRSFAVDNDGDMERTLDPADDGPNDSLSGGFSADPKLSTPRWIIAVPVEPLSLPVGSKIKVKLTQAQKIDAKPAILKRVRLSLSSDPKWNDFAKDYRTAQLHTAIAEAKDEINKIAMVSVPIMAEQEGYDRRVTLKFDRGNFLNPIGSPLRPDVPKLFAKPVEELRDRLEMASWFFNPEQPLTARVAVNRFWEQLFGTGIVETLEDFGSSGQFPSNPQLLDWLALRFQNELQWDMKALLRELVTSATYRQSS